MGAWADFKKFASRGDFLSMAVGIVVGIAVTSVVSGLVTNVINPTIGLAGGGNLNTLGNVTVGGSTYHFGALASDVLNFVIVLVVAFFAIVYPIEQARQRVHKPPPPAPPTTRECPECCSAISVRARKCAFCGSAVTPTAP
ncbi:MAG: MscL family protein [Thermoplasmata archaeon]